MTNRPLRTRTALLLWLASSVFIVYGTSLPFHFVLDTRFAAARLAATSFDVLPPSDASSGVSVSDMVQNVLLFVPFGALGFVVLRHRWQWRPSIALVTASLLGAALSVLVETLQLFTIDRSASVNDVFTNSLGAALGAIGAPMAIVLTRRGVRYLQSRGVAATASSLYTALVAIGLVAVAAWHPFQVTLSADSIWQDVKAVIQDSMQVGIFADEGADALRYGLLAAAIVLWLEARGRARPYLVAALAASAAACAFEASQVFFEERRPGLEDVLVGVGGACAGAIACASPIRRWRRSSIATLIVILAWASAAVITLTPFDWAPERRPFGWTPFLSYYNRTSGTTVSHVVELMLAFFPVGFAVTSARIGKTSIVAVTTIALLCAVTVEYLQGWTVTRIPDVSDGFAMVLGAWMGAYMAGPARSRFIAAVGLS